MRYTDYKTKIITAAWLLAMVLLALPYHADAAQMSDYCVTPPYIGSSITPNLLLMIDNSASMYDLEYTDTSHYYCANNPTGTACTYGSTCSGPASCLRSATTTTTTTTVPAACTPGLMGDAYCTALRGSSDTCQSTGNNKNQCQHANITTTTVTVTPISCTQDSTCSAITAGDICNNRCTVTHSCYDDTFDNSKVCSVSRTGCTTNANCPTTEQCVGRYDGYFTQAVNYCYSSASTSPQLSCTYTTHDEFDGGPSTNTAMPNTCTYGGASSTTPYLCINVDGATGRVSQFIATGNFLNWLSMSKFDIEKKILTGGKYSSAPPYHGNLVAETRGCSGRKFVKSLPAIPDLTFAVRGGTTGLNSITSQATEHGTSFIEVYKGHYNAAACNAAVNDWMNVDTTNLGTVQGDTNCCLAGGTSMNGCNPSSIQLTAAYQTIHDCYWYFNGHGLSNMQPIENDCVKDWSNVSPPSITNPEAGDAICSSVLTHPLFNGNTQGYLGLCFNGVTGLWDDTCALKENKDFCQAMGGAGVVTDPQSGTVAPTAVQNVPGFVIGSGLLGLTMINDYSATGGTMGFQVAVFDSTSWNIVPPATWPPTGIIDQYKNLIRFGVMAFQNNGSGSECNQNGYCANSPGTSCVADCGSNGKCIFPIPCPNVCLTSPGITCYQNTNCPNLDCTSLTKTDGANFTDAHPEWAYLGNGSCSVTVTLQCVVDADCPGTETCNASVGNHTSGLINVIDNITATSWTPFAEAFYNSMGYFARTNDYPAPPAKVVPTSRTEFNFSGYPASYDTSKNPSQRPCQKNNVLIITDGMSTADINSQVNGSLGLATEYSSAVSAAVGSTMPTDYSSQCSYSGSASLPVLTWVANHRNIKNLSMTDPNVKHCTNDLFGTTCATDADCGGTPGVICTNLPTRSSESIQTWVVYTNPTTTTASTLCDPYTLMNESATNGGTKMFQASSVSALSQKLATAFDQVAARAASGTAASVLASREGSGANIIQTVFYPHKVFTNTQTGVDDEINWIGRLANLWYWVDPLTNNNNVREDDGIASGSTTNSNPSGGNKILRMKTDSSNRDYIVNMRYDKIAGVTMADRFTDSQGNGLIGTQVLPSITFENLGNLWEVGTILWERNINTAAGKRKIYTTIDGQHFLSGNFSNNTINPTPAHGTADADNSSTLAPYLQTSLTSTTEASNLISWVTGSDVAGYRSRTVKMEAIDPAKVARVWKLGDIVNSTPKIMSWKPLNSFQQKYSDGTYGTADTLESPSDSSHFVTTDAYKDRNVVFVGGNDGMLHAFNMGIMQQSWSPKGATDVARMVVDRSSGTLCSAGTTAVAPTCGKELWAFIPKNALPYLKYMADPSYCHVYSVDLTPYILDASIGGASDTADTPRTVSSWRTILIGGMRFGGACKSSTDPCTNCVKTPTSVGGADVGFSSYFAIDVTDPASPSLLWEFSNPALGFSTTGAAVVRINGKTAGTPDKTTNGNWFVVLGSGPTGPISTIDHQFMGTSDQALKLFVLDLKTGSLLSTISPPGLGNAFAGSLVMGALDLDNADYQDELVYVPYVTKDAATNTWTNGGVGRIMTKRDPDPTHWTWSRLIDGVGPVTTAVGKIFDKTSNNLWVYFGTGRYYFAQTNTYDNPTGEGYLFGIKDPCESAIENNIDCTASDPAISWCGNGCSNPTDSPSCTQPTNCDDLRNTTDTVNVPLTDDANGSSFKGCYISLDPDGLFTYPPDTSTNFMAERVLTDPVASSATGVVYFNSYKPYTDICMLSGKSFTWAMQYNTCGPVSGLRGTVLVQSSTGAIQQINLQSPEGNPPPGSSGGRRLPTIVEGLIGGGMSVIAPPGPAKRVVHIRER